MRPSHQAVGLKNPRERLGPDHQRPVYNKQMSAQLLRTVWDATFTASFLRKIVTASDIIGTMKRLLESGANPNAVNPDGKTCLHYIMEYKIEGSSEIVDLLLSSGASPNIADNFKNTPLMIASMSKIDNQEEVRKLIAAGADVNMTDLAGRTSVHWAAKYGKIEILQMLLVAGAAADPLDDFRITPLLLTMENIEFVATNQLISRKLISCEQSFAVARMLTTAGANVNAMHSFSCTTCLQSACRNGDLDTVDLLLSKGATLSAVDRDGVNALLYASESGNVEVVRKLVDAGADINYTNKKGKLRISRLPISALHIAIERDDVKMLDFLLEQGANPNQTNDLDNSALALAVLVDHKNAQQMMKILLSHGADRYARGMNSRSSLLELLVTENRVAVTQFLLAHGLIDLSKYNPQTRLDFSPLHAAIKSRSGKDMLSVLLKYNTKGSLNLEHEDREGNRPALCEAVLNGSYHCVRLLLEAGADVDHVDRGNRSPLEIASTQGTYMSEQCKRIIKLLIDAGAKLRNVLGELVVRHERENHHLEVAKYIIKWRVLYESQRSSVADPLEHNDMGGSVELLTYYEGCKNEILILQNSILHGTISHYDLLIPNFYKRVRDDEVYKKFEENVQERFPFYAEDLKERFKNVKMEHDRWELSVKKLSQCLRFDPDTYYLAIRNILDRLDEGDLRSVAEC